MNKPEWHWHDPAELPQEVNLTGWQAVGVIVALAGVVCGVLYVTWAWAP